MAFADAFDMTFAITKDMKLMINHPLPIVMLTDSLFLFDLITKTTVTTEKRFMIDIKKWSKTRINVTKHNFLGLFSPTVTLLMH